MFGSVVTTGGLAALILKIVRSKKIVKAAGECNPKEKG